MAFGLAQLRTHQVRWDDLRSANDTDLVRLLAAGQGDALAVIIDRYQRLVLTIARRIVKDESEAEDVVQTVFLEILKEVAQFDPDRGSLKTWLMQYAYSRSINRRRYLEHRQFYSRVDMDDLDMAKLSPHVNALEGMVSGETTCLIRQALGALNEKQQLAIDLIYFEGLTVDEAAKRAGETVPAIRHQYYRGLMKLREIIQSPASIQNEDSARAESLRLGMQNARPRTI
ncbi:MAG TPA: sigma-70 family RNA polymerase sigma factor [Candidatus Koribacter sp.]|jgi:RNA polymerase sigma-70 factor (ECF subfamily)